MQKLIIQVYDNLQVEIVINNERNGYAFKTPRGYGGRHYYSLCNHVADAFAEQYPEIEFELRNNTIR